MLSKVSDIVYGGCPNHPNFSLISCPLCKIEIKKDATELIDSEIEKTLEKIEAGKYIISQAKKQLKILYSRKKEFDRIKNKIKHYD